MERFHLKNKQKWRPRYGIQLGLSVGKSKFGVRYLRIGGTIIMNPRMIANEIGRKFEYNSSNTNCSVNFLRRKENLDMTSPIFNDNNIEYTIDCNRPFEIYELDKVLNNINGTSAGLDHIRYEMIQIFNNKVKLTFYNTLTHYG